MTKIKHKDDGELVVELEMYDQKQGFLQVTINGSLYEIQVRGNVEVIVDEVTRFLKVGANAEALQVIWKYKFKGSKTLVDFLDIEEMHEPEPKPRRKRAGEQ